MTDKPLVNKKYLLEKFPGKGGWTYAKMPEIKQASNTPFGWVRVCGTIDDYVITGYHLMPMGNGQLFLPIKAAIRKKIGKKEGDYVQVILYADDKPTELPEELKLCLLDEPVAYKNFQAYSDAEQKAFIEWVYAAKTEKTKTERIVKMIEKLIKLEKLTVVKNNN